GYAVVPWKQRRGYATAALAAILPEARRIGLGQIELTCDPENRASIRVIEANGGMLAGRFQAAQYGGAWKLRYVIPLRPPLVTARLTL
uniref:GNAT family N-acetyltransferase n=1 Tax=Klebsiella pneumoniae TaxID=573 RepID=UPI0013D73CCE